MILVTGSEGFIGKAICKALKLNDMHYFACPSSSMLDLCDLMQVRSLPKAKIILHFAAKTSIPESFELSNEYYRNNILSTLNILDKAKMDGAKVLFLSTYLYGTPKYLPVDEIHPLQPMNPYTQSKVICEELCIAYARDFSIPVTILRPFNIYGPGQSSQFFIPTVLSQIDQLEIYLQDSKPKRDFVFIKDLTDLIILLLKQDFRDYEVYNVGSGVSYSIKEVVDKILEISNSDAKVIYTNIARKGEVSDCVASIKKLYDKFGWRPSISINEGLRMMVNAHKNKCN